MARFMRYCSNLCWGLLAYLFSLVGTLLLASEPARPWAMLLLIGAAVATAAPAPFNSPHSTKQSQMSNKSAVMPFVFSQSKPGLWIIALALLFAMAGCGNSTIVGKWRLMGGSNTILWEFSANGAVLIGDVRGRYKFGDQDRIKIETPFATTVYQMTISGDRMTLQEPGGSKLEFTRIRETQR